MSTSLEILSEDVLDLIISFIDHLPVLAVLARVSKHFNRLTLPHLYANVSFVGAASDTGTKHLRPLTFLMLQKPQLAALVRALTLRSAYASEDIRRPIGDEPGWIGWPQHSGLDVALKTAIKAQLGRDTEAATGPLATHEAATKDENDEAAEDEAEKCFQLVRAGFNEAAILALLLPNLVNLQSMDVPFVQEYDELGEGFSVQSHFIMKMFERAATRQKLVQNRPIFGGLTDVIISGTNDKDPNDPLFFGACVGLPAIKRLFGFNQGNVDDFNQDNDNQNIFSGLEPGSSSLEFIELRMSKLNMLNFSKLLQAPICLKTFIYEIGNTWAWTRVKFSEIQLALNFQKDNLERLCLSHDHFYPFVPGIDDELTPLSFSCFSFLKHLCVAPIYLYGGERLQLGQGDGMRNSNAPPVSPEDIASTRMLLKEVLPEQLETLSLVFCNDASTLDRLLDSLREVLSYKEEQFSHLREVSIHAMNFETLNTMLEAFTVLPWKAKSVRLIVGIEAKVEYSANNYRERRWGWDEDVEWADCINNICGPVDILYDSQEHV